MYFTFTSATEDGEPAAPGRHDGSTQMNTSSTTADGHEARGAHYIRREDRPARPRWRPLEIAAVVVGFMLYWPIGLALLFWKLWRNKQGATQDIVSAARGAFEENVMSRWPDMTRGWNCGSRAARRATQDWAPTGWRSTGNTAFDDWRSAELARLEDERRKLEAAEREFADYIESLRRAKDREEFERFMRDRNGGASAPSATN